MSQKSTLETIIVKDTIIQYGEEEDNYIFNQKDEIEEDGIKIDSLPNYLTDNVVIILDSINSGSGRKNNKNIYTHILKPLFTSLSIKYEYVATTSVDSIRKFASGLTHAKITIIFISGDTSINEFVNGLSDTNEGSINVFTIPGGTGNSLALSIGITDQIKAITKVLTSKTIDPLNLYNVNFPEGSYYSIQNEAGELVKSNLKFLVVFSWGFHASLVADSDTPELRKYGLKRFQIAAKNNLSRPQKYDGELSINDETIKGPFAYFLFTPSTKFEPTFEISPKGDILKDNLFFVGFNYKANDTKYILDVMHQVYDKGSHVDNDSVEYREIKTGDKLNLRVSKSTLDNLKFCVDGSIVQLANPEVDNNIQISVGDNKQHKWTLFIIH